MKFKRKLKKLFFYDRSFIKMVCLLIILLLVMIFGNSFGYVSADDSNYLLNNTDYQASSIFNSNANYNNRFGGAANQNSAISYDYFVNDFDYSAYNSNISADSIKYYMIFGHSYTTKDYVFLFPDDAFVYVSSPYTWSCCIMSKSPTIYRASVSAWGDGTTLDHLYINTDAGSNDLDGVETINITSTTSVELNGVTWYYTFFGDDAHKPILGNCPFYTCSISTDLGAYKQTVESYFDTGANADKVIDINYMSNTVLLPGFENLDGALGGADSDETTENNLYLRDSKWTFSMPKWKNLTSYSGNATFSASLNDFQQENLSDFYLDFTFTIHTSQSYVNSSYVPSDGGSSGGGHGTEIYDANSYTTGYVSGIFKYKDSSTNNDYLRVSLQDFYNMGSSKAFMSLNGIFDRCYKVGFSGNSSSTTFVNWYSDAVNSSQYTTTKAILYCYATLYDSSGNSSGNCVYYYDLLNGTSGVTDSSMSVNNNPYVDEDGNVEGEVTTEGTTTDTYNGNGVNVTQTVNVNNDSGDSKSWLWTLISSLISSDDENVSQAGMSNTLINFVGINPWISLMSTTFGFIPAAIWTTLSACFLVVMGILVVAFVLRIILDLL